MFSLKASIERLAIRKAREHAVRMDQEFHAIRLGILTQDRFATTKNVQDHPAFDVDVISFNNFIPLRLKLTPEAVQMLCDRWMVNVLMGDEYNCISGLCLFSRHGAVIHLRHISKYPINIGFFLFKVLVGCGEVTCFERALA